MSVGLQGLAQVAEKLLTKPPEFGIKPDIVLRDEGIIKTISEKPFPELVKSAKEQLLTEGEPRPGSAEYLDVMAKSTNLDEQVKALEQGIFDPQKLENKGIEVMIDSNQTTPELLSQNKVFLNEDSRKEFLGAINSLEYKLNQHIKGAINKASEYYATELSTPETLAEQIGRKLGVKKQPNEIPFTPNQEEIKILEELYTRKYATPEERKTTFKRTIEQIMRNRPGSIDLEATASTASFLGQHKGELNEIPTDITNLRRLHSLFRGHGMRELQIHGGFANIIEESGHRAIHENIYPDGLTYRLSQQTENWAKSKDLNGLMEDLLPKEHLQATEIGTEINTKLGTENAENFAESDKYQDNMETLKLVVRIAIKVNAKIAVSIARNLAKDQNLPQELRTALGVFADLTTEGEKFAEKVISGEEKPNLEKDCVAFIQSMFN